MKHAIFIILAAGMLTACSSRRQEVKTDTVVAQTSLQSIHRVLTDTSLTAITACVDSPDITVTLPRDSVTVHVRGRRLKTTVNHQNHSRQTVTASDSTHSLTVANKQESKRTAHPGFHWFNVVLIAVVVILIWKFIKLINIRK